MKTVSINNESHTLNDSVSLQDYLTQQLTQETLREPFAVAVNGEFVPRSQYSQTALNDGDSVDIVAPVGGG